MNADRGLVILERFQGVRRSRNGWRALCPAHTDRSPSLSIDERDGKILLYCHAGCTPEAVCAAAGIEKRHLFLDSDPPWRAVAAYDYTDESGALLFRVLRRERVRNGQREKDFPQRRPDGKGGWVWNLSGVRRVPYHLPALITANEVFVCEGEKDCDRLASLGLVATTNPGGAGKWLPEFGNYFIGKRVCILPDNDDVGRQHVQEVAASLKPLAAAVKVLELQGVPERGDVSDWLNAGHAKEELLALVEQAPVWETGGESQRPRIEIIPADQFLKRRSEDERDWLVENLLPAQSQTIWQGRPKVGKSHTLLQLAFDAAAGLLAFGRFVTRRPTRVLYAEFEEPEAVTKDRLAKMMSAHGGSGPESGNLGFLTRNDLYRWKLLPRELLYSQRRDFARVIQDSGIELVVLVALRLLLGGDRNDLQVAEGFNDALDFLAHETKAAIALANHDRKASAPTAEARGFGSTMFTARADAILDFSRPLSGLRLVEVEARYPSPEAFLLNREPVGEGELIRIAEDPEERKTMELRKRVAGGESIRQAAKAEGIPYSTARRLIQD